jgi:hypothetical protein
MARGEVLESWRKNFFLGPQAGAQHSLARIAEQIYVKVNSFPATILE